MNDSMPPTPGDYEGVPVELMQQLSNEFNQLTFARHTMGAEEYGEFAFLKNPMTQFIAEELADLSNYARYTYMKIRLWEEHFNVTAGSTDLSSVVTGGGEGSADEVPLDFASSGDASAVSGVLPDDRGVQDPGQRSGGEDSDAG